MKIAGFVNHIKDYTKMLCLTFKSHRHRRTAVGIKTYLAIKLSRFFSRFHITKYGILTIEKKNFEIFIPKSLFLLLKSAALIKIPRLYIYYGRKKYWRLSKKWYFFVLVITFLFELEIKCRFRQKYSTYFQLFEKDNSFSSKLMLWQYGQAKVD
jgi:hypothetical protein